MTFLDIILAIIWVVCFFRFFYLMDDRKTKTGLFSEGQEAKGERTLWIVIIVFILISLRAASLT